MDARRLLQPRDNLLHAWVTTAEQRMPALATPTMDIEGLSHNARFLSFTAGESSPLSG
jgi:hypothetical protein